MTRRSFLANALAALVALVVGAGVVGAPREAAAQAASVQVTVIVASSGAGGVDAALQPYASRLGTQFANFSSFSQSSAHRLALMTGQAQSFTLPGGSSCTVTLMSASGTQYEFRVDVPGGGTTVRSPTGSLFFVAGPPAPGGTIILMFQT
jgi:hypothetical protein